MIAKQATLEFPTTQCKLNRDKQWFTASRDFLQAVPQHLQAPVEHLLNSIHCGGSGIREWISQIAYRNATLPKEIPAELIEVYLCDPEAIPLHDCECCGIAVPVRPNRQLGLEGEPEHVYFPSCPVCNGQTGWFAFWSHSAETETEPQVLRMVKPR